MTSEFTWTEVGWDSETGFYTRKQMPTADFTHSDLIESLRLAFATKDASDGLTTKEILTAMNLPDTSCQQVKLRKIIGIQIREGRLEPVLVQRPTISGRMTMVSAYRVKEAN